MKEEKEKKGLFGRIFGNKKKKSCCCKIEIEELPEEKNDNKEKEKPEDTKNPRF